MSKPTLTPEIKERFAAYHRRNAAWGSLHIVLDDGNIKDSYVRFCIDEAKRHGDIEGYSLGEILLAMSKTQRGKLSRDRRGLSE